MIQTEDSSIVSCFVRFSWILGRRAEARLPFYLRQSKIFFIFMRLYDEHIDRMERFRISSDRVQRGNPTNNQLKSQAWSEKSEMVNIIANAVIRF